MSAQVDVNIQILPFGSINLKSQNKEKYPIEKEQDVRYSDQPATVIERYDIIYNDGNYSVPKTTGGMF